MSYVGSEATEQCEDCELQLKFSLLTYLLVLKSVMSEI